MPKRNRAVAGARNNPSKRTCRRTGEYMTFELFEGGRYSLIDIMAELNRDYFDNRIHADITWSDAPGTQVRTRPCRSARVAWTDPLYHIIYIHRRLDTPEVPRIVLKWYVFHEMLHLKHHTSGHPARFRIEESTFEKYHEMRQWEGTHAHLLLVH